jgi:uncharacterized membrane protein YeaQ/YmgE (transglycosylase-associated protein family)
MEGFNWIMWIIIGGLAGWIASIILRVRTGIIWNIILGIVGAVLLNFILDRLFHVAYGGFWGQLVVAIIGAGILMVILRAVTGRNI